MAGNWRMKEGESFPLVADKATWVWTPTKLSLSVRILHPSLAIEALLTSSFSLIPRPPLDLGLPTLFQATNLHKILSQSSLFLFISLKQCITCKGELTKLAFIRVILPTLERNWAFHEANFFWDLRITS